MSGVTAVVYEQDDVDRLEASHAPGRSRVVVDVSSLGEERASWLCRDLGQLVDVVQADLETTEL